MKATTMRILNKIEARSQKPEARKLPATRHFAVLQGVFLASGFWLLASSAHAQDAQTLVSQMKQAEATITYSATQKTGNGNTTRVFRSGLKRRVEWLSPDVKRGDIMVDNGANVFLYHRAEKSATKTDSRSRVPSFVATGAATPTKFAGRRAFSVAVSNRRTLVIDAQTKALLAVRGGNGGFALSNIMFGSIAPAKFNFAAPAGVKVNAFPGALYPNLNGAKRAATWIQTPAKLPPGWSFESAIVGQKSAWLRYSDGQNRISLFEQPTSDHDLAPNAVNGGTFWKRGGVRFLATGSPSSVLDQVVGQLK